MTAYFDTSALVPLVIEEPSSRICERAWNATDTVVASSLAYVEARAAVAQANRGERITKRQLERATEVFDEIWAQVTVVTPTDALIRRAAQLAESHALRGYDAVHCATALAVASERSFAATGDSALLAAWHELGLATVDVNQELARDPAKDADLPPNNRGDPVGR